MGVDQTKKTIVIKIHLGNYFLKRELTVDKNITEEELTQKVNDFCADWHVVAAHADSITIEDAAHP